MFRGGTIEGLIAFLRLEVLTVAAEVTTHDLMLMGWTSALLRKQRKLSMIWLILSTSGLSQELSG